MSLPYLPDLELGERSASLSNRACANLKRRFVRIAQREEKVWYRYWRTYHRRKRVECERTMLSRLISYWRAVPRRRRNGSATQKAQSSARGSTAWSAAFISGVMNETGVGVGHGFVASGRHMDYIQQAILNKENNRRDKPFWGFKLSEVRPQVGDLICLNRGSTRHTYTKVKDDRFRMINGRPDKRSHCDIVVDKFTTGGKTFIEVVGGNVGDTVSSRVIPLKRGRYPTRATFGMGGNIFAILRLNLCNNLDWNLTNR